MSLRRVAVAAAAAVSLSFATFTFAPQCFAGTSPSGGAADTKTEKSVIAVFRLDSAISESPGDDLSLFGKKPTSLRELISNLNKASDDANVKAIVLLNEGGSVGIGQLEEIRQALEKCRKAGKPVFAHSDSMDLRDYVLFTGADRISVVPTADIFVPGLHSESPYLKGLLDKLGVQPDFLHCGDYKSAAEIFMREGPSPEAEKMTNWLLDGIFDTAVDMIAKGRKVDTAKVHQWIDTGMFTAEKAKAAGMIDAVEQRQDFEAMLKQKFGSSVTFEKKYGQPKQETIDFNNPFALFKVLGEIMSGDKKKAAPTKPGVGIVYVDGEISLGSGDDSPFSSGGGAHSTDIRKALDQAANDDNIKAVVLRVDSPGGSAVASEIILDATRRVKAKKPFVVSMGNVAGSGGYYVSCASDTVFADRSTITASIGVVGGKMVTTDMWKKVGISFKEYNRGKNAALMSTSRAWNDEERETIMTWMNDVYGVFKHHVTAIRGDRLKKPIDELAGGRVFTGKQALDLGLVDKIGTMQDAIEFVATNASLGSDYDVRVVPEPKNFLEKLMEDSNGGGDDPAHVMIGAARAVFGDFGHGGSIVDLAMPYLQNLDLERVSKIRAALRTLDMMQREGVILTTPELMTVSSQSPRR